MSNAFNFPFSYQRIHTARQVNTNSLAFLVTGNAFGPSDNIYYFEKQHYESIS